MFKKITLNLENGKQFVIDAPENSSRNIYIDGITIDGKDYDKNYITQGMIDNGGGMEIKMSDKPNMTRGTTEEAYPYSFSNELKQTETK